jgi:hypothetical protein
MGAGGAALARAGFARAELAGTVETGALPAVFCTAALCSSVSAYPTIVRAIGLPPTAGAMDGGEGAGAGGTDPSAVTAPHWPQNRAPSASGWPHWAQLSEPIAA